MGAFSSKNGFTKRNGFDFDCSECPETDCPEGVENTGDAVAADVASGKTFSSAALTNVAGSSTKNAVVPGDAPIQPAQAFVDAMVAALSSGVFVAGGLQDGIYTVRGVNEGKSYYILLGKPIDGADAGPYAFTWVFARWRVFDFEGSQLYYSLSDVATPDLATNWKNYSDDSPASITVDDIASTL